METLLLTSSPSCQETKRMDRVSDVHLELRLLSLETSVGDERKSVEVQSNILLMMPGLRYGESVSMTEGACEKRRTALFEVPQDLRIHAAVRARLQLPITRATICV